MEAPGPMTDQAGGAEDQRAIERYRYLLRTAPPETIEQAHAEAFARLTPEQRRQVLDGLSGVLPENERMASDDPDSLARMATRAEMRQPGTLERTFGGMGGGIGIGGSFMTMLAASFVGTAMAQAFFGDHGDLGGTDASGAGATDADGGADQEGVADAGAEGGLDGSDLGGGDFGGDDFGGGDFGGI